MFPLRRLTSSVLIFSLLAAFLHGSFVRISASNPNVDETSKETGLQFRLSHGANQPETRSATKPVSASELSQSEIETVLKRLPRMKENPSEEFALRDNSLPPPRTGNTIDTSFPAAGTAVKEAVTSGPLQVVRYSPEGSVPLAPELSITFSQPMIALTSQEDAATNVPVKLNPQPPGKWRWLGTKTLRFQPDGRFPMATTYVVTVPAGTRAANGSELTSEKSWSFTTPPPSVKTTFPASDNPQPRDALMFIEFDQRIDPAEVLRAVKVTSSNRTISTRLATSDEMKQAIARDRNGTARLQEAVNGRWLVFRAIDPRTGQPDLALPSSSQIKVFLIAGAPSAEGPSLTQKPYEFTFNTYGPLKVNKHDCEGSPPCKPDESFEIEFNNELADDLDVSKVKVEPAMPEMEMNFYGSTLEIDGVKRGSTTYSVTLDKSIKDKFNQTLGRDFTFTFKVGPSHRKFVGPDNFVVMDPAAPTRCSVYSINYTKLNVKIYSVTPNDWPRWRVYQKETNDHDSKTNVTPPGRLFVSKTVSIRNAPNDIVATSIDLRPALTNGRGQLILIVEPSGGTPVAKDDDFDISESWIQVTNIGLDAFVDQTDVVGWVTSLKDGAPLSNVEVTLLPSDVIAKTGADGLARMALKSSSSTEPGLMVARRGDDVAILPENVAYWNEESGGWLRKSKTDSLRWFVFDDRKMYQPGEEVHVKGWIRRVGGGKTGDTGALDGATTNVTYVLNDSRGLQVKSGSVAVNALGGFDLALKLPDTMNLGYTSLKLEAVSTLAGNDHRHHFQVQEFRRPEFEVETKVESEGPFFVGAGADISLRAAYYAGGGLPDAPVNWYVNATTTQFTPPNRSAYNFGAWVPWWGYGGYVESTLETLSGVTDGGGKHRLHIDFERVNPARPSLVTASANVSDVNRQTWSSSTTLLVHPANLYVGLKSDKTFAEPNQPLTVDAIVTDLDGNLVEGREIKMVATRLSWRKEKDDWIEVENDPKECVIRSSASTASCTFQPKEGGEYSVKATIRDDRERRNESELKFWVSGSQSLSGPDVEEGNVELIPDRNDYKAGDTAEILVQAPFFPAEGVLSVRRSGIVKVDRFRMDGPTTTLRVQIEEGWAPNVHVEVDLVGETERESSGNTKRLPKQPAYAGGKLKSGYSSTRSPAHSRCDASRKDTRAWW